MTKNLKMVDRVPKNVIFKLNVLKPQYYNKNSKSRSVFIYLSKDKNLDIISDYSLKSKTK